MQPRPSCAQAAVFQTRIATAEQTDWSCETVTVIPLACRSHPVPSTSPLNFLSGRWLQVSRRLPSSCLHCASGAVCAKGIPSLEKINLQTELIGGAAARTTWHSATRRSSQRANHGMHKLPPPNVIELGVSCGLSFCISVIQAELPRGSPMIARADHPLAKNNADLT